MSRTYTVYKGEEDGKLVYIGTTVQLPKDRFRWHKHNGKRYQFTVLSTHPTAEAMLEEEYRLIQLHRPRDNKITDRRQNLNVKLTPAQLEARRGDKAWCQGCLRRKPNPRSRYCRNCP